MTEIKEIFVFNINTIGISAIIFLVIGLNPNFAFGNIATIIGMINLLVFFALELAYIYADIFNEEGK